MNCVFGCETKWNDYLLEMTLIQISSYLTAFTQNSSDASVKSNKDYTILFRAN